VVRLLVTAALATCLPGCWVVYDDCGDCGPCRPALELQLVDAVTGEPVDGALVTVHEPTREATSLHYDGTCAFGHEPATYWLTVEAPGYEAQEVGVVLPANRHDGCCTCPAFETTHEVRLEPLMYECSDFRDVFGCCCVAAECSDEETCVANGSVASAVSGAGRCVPVPSAGRCWTSADCAAEEICAGAELCPCSASCIVPDSMGDCVSRR